MNRIGRLPRYFCRLALASVFLMAGIMFPCAAEHGWAAARIAIAPTNTLAIDTSAELAFVPAGFSRKVVVVNLKADLDTTNSTPIVTTLATTDSQVLNSVFDSAKHLAVVTSEAGAAIAPADEDFVYANTKPLPTLKHAATFPTLLLPTSPMIFVPPFGAGIVGVCTYPNCPPFSAGPGNGLVLFSLAAKSFLTFSGSPIIQAPPPNYLGLDQNNLIIDSSPFSDNGHIAVIKLNLRKKTAQVCALPDANLTHSSAAANQGAAVDGKTGIVLVSFGDTTAAALNLHGGTFSSSPSGCSYNEAGQTPNSQPLGGLPVHLEGGVVNPVTHQAFIASAFFGYSGIALVSLPKHPVSQLQATDISWVAATLPNDPNNQPWSGQRGLFAVDSVHNLAYVVSQGTEFAPNGYLTQIDLTQFQNHPELIGTALGPGSGSCSPNSCTNGNGVTFFPLVN